MIKRIIVVSPENHEDLLVFQVPENSAAERLLCLMLEQGGHEFVTLPSACKRKKKKTEEPTEDYLRSINEI